MIFLRLKDHIFMGKHDMARDCQIYILCLSGGIDIDSLYSWKLQYLFFAVEIYTFVNQLNDVD